MKITYQDAKHLALSIAALTLGWMLGVFAGAVVGALFIFGHPHWGKFVFVAFLATWIYSEVMYLRHRSK